MSDISAVSPSSNYLKYHIAPEKGVIGLVKSMNQEAQQFTDRDLLHDLSDATQKAPQGENLPSVEFLDGLEAHLKLINSHIVPVTRIGQQYVKLRRNQLKLDQAQQKLDNINLDISEVQTQAPVKLEKSEYSVPSQSSALHYQNLPMGNTVMFNSQTPNNMTQDIHGTSYKIIPFEIPQ